jgi:hypothetical protein
VLRKVGKFVLVLLLFSVNLYAQTVSVEVDPTSPAANKVFNVTFKMSGKKATLPSISFDPRNVEVLGRENRGLTTRTTYMNGKLTVTREVVIVYEMIAAKSGTARLADIRVDFGDKVVRHRDVRINILRKSSTSGNFFVAAIPTKTKLFVGESIMLDYYVYSKGQISSREIRKFPVLKDFVKRFVQKNERQERVRFNGKIYYRFLMYSSQLFPLKSGNIRIDPITVRIQYSKSSNDPFGGLSFGFRSLQTKTLTSKPVVLDVRALPVVGKPDNFTGLVGPHSVKLKINKTKLLVNEPIELTFEITGAGLLENFEAPAIFKNDSIEDFETSVDLKLTKTEQASKVFKYTYLGRKNFRQAQKVLEFPIFDPESNQYIVKSVTLPAVVVMGGAVPAVTNNTNPSTDDSQDTPSSNVLRVNNKTPVSIVAPHFDFETTKDFDITSKINYFLLVLVCFFILFDGFKAFKSYHVKTNFDKNLHLIKNGKISYVVLYKAFYPFISGQDSISDALEKMTISDKAKKAFRSALDVVEKNTYATNNEKHNQQKISIKDSYIHELKDLFENENNI